jgi:hypothetical protein
MALSTMVVDEGVLQVVHHEMTTRRERWMKWW